MKLIDLVCSRRLPMVRLDCLGDPNEGAIAPGSTILADLVSIDKDGHQTPIGEHLVADELSAYASQLGARTLQYASCWNEQSNESAALWKLYAADNGVMIEVPTDYLTEVIASRNGVIRRITYCDIYTSSQLDGRDAFSISTRKDHAYSFEAEVRLLFQQSFLHGVDPAWRISRDGEQQIAMPKVQYLSFDPARIAQITISPDRSAWQEEALRRVLNFAGCSAKIAISRLAAPAGVAAPNAKRD